jgi:hypothetical protein
MPAVERDQVGPQGTRPGVDALAGGIDVSVAGPNALRGKRTGTRVRLRRTDGVDPGWVERDDEARSESDLRNRPVEVRADTRADLPARRRHDGVPETRENPRAVAARLGCRRRLHDRLVDSGQGCRNQIPSCRGSEDGRRRVKGDDSTALLNEGADA